MKFQSQILLADIDKSTVKNFTLIVEEKLDVPERVQKQKKFTSAELWMIEKRRRVFYTRKYI